LIPAPSLPLDFFSNLSIVATSPSPVSVPVNDAQRMLAELEASKRFAPSDTLAVQPVKEYDLETFRAEMAAMSPTSPSMSHTEVKHTNDRWVSQAEELEAFRATITADPPMSPSSSYTEATPVDDKWVSQAEELAAFRAKITADSPTSPPINHTEAKHVNGNGGTQTEKGSERSASDIEAFNSIPLREQELALRLEKAGVQNWEALQGWTQYLFSDGPNGHVARRQQQEASTSQALTKTEKKGDRSLQEEVKNCAAKENTILSCRLIVTNIAASAGKEEIGRLFARFESERQQM
jgi:hypothetical protein